MEQALREQREQRLTLAAAAERSGYSADHLGRLVRTGRLPNAGHRGAPRVRAGDLPMRPARFGVAAPRSGSYDPIADARSLVSRQGDR